MVGSVVPCQAEHTLFTLVCRCRSNDYLTDLTQNAKSAPKQSCQYLLDTYSLHLLCNLWLHILTKGDKIVVAM